ncbi:hypothetical protein BC628DRAFT_1416674 [Trametes gibbosa]|nr:hypothetical protein BC628DRAFT_1416674 [Trametes gibbosa]
MSATVAASPAPQSVPQGDSSNSAVKQSSRRKSKKRDGQTQATPTTPTLPFWDTLAGRQQAAAGMNKLVPFWDKVNAERVTATGGESEPDSAGHASSSTPPSSADAPAASHIATASPIHASHETSSIYSTPGSATWEAAGQYALNASILSGRFEDLRIVTFSKCIANESVGAPRILYANRTLLSRTLPNLFNIEEAAGTLEEKATFLANASVPATSYGYAEDSDLEDYVSDEDDGTENAPKVELDDERGGGKQVSPVVAFESDPSLSSEVSPITSVSEEDDNVGGKSQDGGKSKTAKLLEDSPSPTQSDDFVSIPVPDVIAATSIAEPEAPVSETKPKKPTFRSKAAQKPRRAGDSVTTSPRAVVVTDIAYRTWRAVLFYAYTRRIAFAPLHSQGLPFSPVDDENDPAQLPICSPKSMYRLAVKYGNAELQQLALGDIASKLSTHNILTELFSPFTSRYPEIQEVELDFVRVNIRHPDITIRLPAWTDLFARGELKEHADTFGRFIHMLVCAATAAPAGGNVCPQGCAMATVQHRCTMCGLTFV